MKVFLFVCLKIRNMVAYLFPGENDPVMWEKLMRKEREDNCQNSSCKGRGTRIWCWK